MRDMFGPGIMVTSRRPLRAIPFIVGGLANSSTGCRCSVSRTGRSANRRTRLLLVVRPGERYLQDSEGKPFLLHGDKAWSLIAQLTREEVERYFDDRRARGFNTIVVSLIESHSSADPPAIAYGEELYLEPGNYAAPNDAHFA